MKVVSSLKYYHRLLIIIYKLIILFIFSSISANFLSRFFYRSIKLCDKNCLIRIRDFSSYYTETCTASRPVRKSCTIARQRKKIPFSGTRIYPTISPSKIYFYPTSRSSSPRDPRRLLRVS